MVEHLGGDLHQVGVQVALVPLVEHVGYLLGFHAQAAAHKVVGLGNDLHIRVLDAVVDHLDEVARPITADVGHAGFTLRLGGNGLENGPQGLPGLIGATGHHGGPQEGPLLATGNAAAHKVQTTGANRLLAADGVLEVGVAGIDDDVAGLHQVGQVVDHLVGRLARLDHDDGGAGPGQGTDELLKGLGGNELPLVAMLPDQGLGA